MNNGMLKKKKNGFTLIELLVAIGIIGLLATLAITGVNKARVKARDTARLSTVDNIRKIMSYKLNNGDIDFGCSEVGTTYPVYTCSTFSEYVANLELLKDPTKPTDACNGNNATHCNYAFYYPPYQGKTYILYFRFEGPTNLGNPSAMNCAATQINMACGANVSITGCRGSCSGSSNWNYCYIFDFDGSGCIYMSDDNYAWNNR